MLIDIFDKSVCKLKCNFIRGIIIIICNRKKKDDSIVKGWSYLEARDYFLPQGSIWGTVSFS